MKRRHRILTTLLLIAVSVLPLSAIAVSVLPLSAGAGFPTFDLTGYLQEILGYTQDGQQIANEIKNWENELKRWQQLYKAFEDGDLENILGGINGAVGRLDNTLGRYNISVGWLDGVSDLSTTLTDTGFDIADLVSSGEFSPRDLTRLYDDLTDISTDTISLHADIKAATIDNKKQRASTTRSRGLKKVKNRSKAPRTKEIRQERSSPEAHLPRPKELSHQRPSSRPQMHSPIHMMPSPMTTPKCHRSSLNLYLHQ